MIIASQLRPGAVVKLGEDLLKVIESNFHGGQGKMPGSVHAKLRNIRKGTFKELRWRPEERLDDVQLEKRDMEFLYSDADSVTFMDPQPSTRFLFRLNPLAWRRSALSPRGGFPSSSTQASQ
jgi:elongation factor P